MNKFNKSIGKIINYSSLSNNILLINENMDSFIDIGCGSGNLIENISKKVKCTGVDIENLAAIYKEKKIDFICADITKDVKWLEKYSNKKVIIHLGFCLCNTFTKKIFFKVIKSILSKIPNGMLLFELQNNAFFDKNYLEKLKYTNYYNDIKIISWNETIIRNGEKCKKVIMEYYTLNNSLINKTIDYLYPHSNNWYLEDKYFKEYDIDTYKWSIRNTNDLQLSHIYYQIRRKQWQKLY